MAYSILDIIGAIQEGKFDAFENTVKSGSLDVNFKDEKGRTALHHVVLLDIDSVNRIKWVKLLSSLRADVNVKNNDGLTPMFFAMMKEDTEIMKCLAGIGADIHQPDNEGKTLIFTATGLGKTEAIKCLVSLGVDVNTKDKEGYTPISSAIMNQQEQIASLKYLVKLGADVNARTNQGFTPVFMAVSENKVESLKCLKELGADINAKLSDGRTPLSLGLGFGDVPEAVNWLKANGAV